MNAGPRKNLEENETFRPGAIIDGRYKVVCELGRGGMGHVYRAEQLVLRKDFALKTISPERTSDVGLIRFQKEARAASLLDHPGLVKVYDFGTTGGYPYYVMDLVLGHSLAEHLQRFGPLPVQRALHVFIQVAFALAYAHENQVIHRDLKPGNIMLVQSQDQSAEGQQLIKIVDFGIAKLQGDESIKSLTQTGEIMGSPTYMSPEQCQGIGVDHRTDIYSYGCVLYESLVGVPPFVAESALSLMMQHQNETAPTLRQASLGGEFSNDLELVVAKLLEKNPERRYQSFYAVATDLNRILTGVHVETGSASQRSNGAETPKRTKRQEPEKAFFNKSFVVPCVAVALGSYILGVATGYCLKPDEIRHARDAHDAGVHDKPVLVGTESGAQGASATKGASSVKGADSTNGTKSGASDEDSSSEVSEQANIKDYVQRLRKDHSIRYVTGIENGRQVFRFPDFSLGSFEVGASNERALPAKGIVRLPVDPIVKFRMAPVCLEHPELLEPFAGAKGIFIVIYQPNFDASVFVRPEVEKLVHLPAAVVKSFRSWPDLRILRLDRTQLDAATIEEICKLKHVGELRMDSRGSIDAAGVAKIVKDMPWLQHLNVEHNRGVLAKLTTDLTARSNINNLHLADTSITEQQLATICRFPQLRILSLSENTLSTEMLNEVSKLPLEELQLDSCQIPVNPDAFLQMKSLKVLSMKNPTWSPPVVAKLKEQLLRRGVKIETKITRSVAEELTREATSH